MKWLLPILAALPAFAQGDVHYTLTPDLPARSVRISLRLDDAKAQEELRIPAWCPGFYFIQNYQNKISDVRATDASGKELKVGKRDARAWVIENPAQGPITFSYRVLGDDGGLGFFGVSVRPHTVFVNGPAAFVYSPARMLEKQRLSLRLPEKWQVATGLESEPNGTLVSNDYDEFIDHPLQLGLFERRKFAIDGVPYEVVFVSTNQQYAPDLEGETERIRRLTIPATKMMGGVPFKRYVYLVHLATGNFGGGLEHRASTVLAVPNSRPLDMDSLVTHEFFHVWNVKHIRPKVLGPFDYTQPVRTRNLWFAEGVTDYYAQLHAYQSGLNDENWLLQQLTYQIRELQFSMNRTKLTLEDTSLRAWENGGFGVGDLSYYNKGLVVGLLFDAAIRSATNGQRSLDHVFRLMMPRHQLPKPGYEEEGVLKALNEVAGRDLSALYKAMVQSTEELPYEVLKGIGLRLRGGSISAPSLGYRLTNRIVQTVTPAAEEMGLRVGDRILSVNGQELDEETFSKLRPDSTYRVEVERGQQRAELTLRVFTSSGGALVLERDPFASPVAQARLAEWLNR
ncbi:MAG TPA: PDZ domain-containing protein [Fimbriimonadaceae bacterium]|nr:PDZ domain-containing protein [Fimbriimonadaceae bacterium]